MAVSGRGTIPVVAIVGRPNVGKSTLFNRFLGQRTAIVEDRARTTRDRLYGDTEWNGRRFVIVDTGGLELDPDDPIEARVQEQARLAIAEADVILFVVDATTGLTPADLEAARSCAAPRPRSSSWSTRPTTRSASSKAPNSTSSAGTRRMRSRRTHGRGTGDLLDVIVWSLPPETEAELARKAREAEAEAWADEVAAGQLDPFVVGDPEAGDAADGDGVEGPDLDGVDAEAARWDAAMAAEKDGEPAAIAFVGRPNVGKSSLLNALLGEDRAIVSDVPGTTRDAIDTRLAWGRSEVVLIDTAGIRRRGKVAGGAGRRERYSTLRALHALSRADVAVLVVDAVEGLTSQDAHVAGYVVEEGKGLVIAVNKWDLVEDKTDKTFDQYVEWIRNEVPFLDFAPIVSISAKTGQRVGRVLEAAIDIWGERRKRISTGELNRVLTAATDRTPPPPVRGHRPKLFYATQAAVAPPTFVFFASDASSVHFSYRRYLENQLREKFGFDGTPIRLVFRDRSSVKLPRRKKLRSAPVASAKGAAPRRAAAQAG